MIDSLPYHLRRKALERLKDPYLGNPPEKKRLK